MTRCTIVVALAAVLAGGCGQRESPTSASPITPEPIPAPSLPTALPGVWHGYVKGTECVGALPCDAGKTIPFILRTLAADDGYRATFELPAASAGQMKVIMDVVGRPEADGVVVFSGSRGVIDSDRYQVELFRLAVRIDPASGLTGEIDLHKFPTPNLQKRTLRGQVVSAAYQPWSPPGGQLMSGTWRGRAIIRGCAGYCPIYQDVGDEMTITIVLGQTGDTISGHMQPQTRLGCGTCWLPVAGTVAGSAMSLSSQPYVPPGSTGSQIHLEGFDATVDDLARLAGRFVIAVNGRIAIAPFDVFSRLEYELLWLQRD